MKRVFFGNLCKLHLVGQLAAPYVVEPNCDLISYIVPDPTFSYGTESVSLSGCLSKTFLFSRFGPNSLSQ